MKPAEQIAEIEPLGIDSLYVRQTALFNPSMHQQPIHILGVGMIGSFVAMALSKLGLKMFTLWDEDIVEPHNVPNQLHPASTLGLPKVEATKKVVEFFCKGIDSIAVDIVTKDCHYLGQSPLNGIVVAAADSMKARKLFFEKAKFNPKVKLFVDARVGGQVFRVYAINPCDLDHVELYESTLYSDKEADDTPCHERAVIDVAFFITAMLVRAVRQYLVQGKTDTEIIGDISSLEILVVSPGGLGS